MRATATYVLPQNRRTPPHIRCEIGQVRGYEGYVIYTRTTVEGLKNRNVSLAAYLYRDATRRRLSPDDQELASRAPRPLPQIRLRSPADRFVAFTFIDRPNPARNGRLRDFFARLELRESGEDGTLLAVTNTPPFKEFRQGESGGRPC